MRSACQMSWSNASIFNVRLQTRIVVQLWMKTIADTSVCKPWHAFVLLPVMRADGVTKRALFPSYGNWNKPSPNEVVTRMNVRVCHLTNSTYKKRNSKGQIQVQVNRFITRWMDVLYRGEIHKKTFYSMWWKRAFMVAKEGHFTFTPYRCNNIIFQFKNWTCRKGDSYLVAVLLTQTCRASQLLLI